VFSLSYLSVKIYSSYYIMQLCTQLFCLWRRQTLFWNFNCNCTFSIFFPSLYSLAQVCDPEICGNEW